MQNKGEENSIMKDKGPEIFLREKPSKILISLHRESTENYASALSTQVDCTYSHTVRLIQKFDQLGLIETKKEGRKKIVELTNNGETIASNLSDVFNKLE